MKGFSAVRGEYSSFGWRVRPRRNMDGWWGEDGENGEKARTPRIEFPTTDKDNAI